MLTSGRPAARQSVRWRRGERSMRPPALVFDPEFEAVVKSPKSRVTTKSLNVNSHGLRDGRRGGPCPGRHVRRRGALMAVFGWAEPRCLRTLGGRGYAPSRSCRPVSRRCAFGGRSSRRCPPLLPCQLARHPHSSVRCGGVCGAGWCERGRKVRRSARTADARNRRPRASVGRGLGGWRSTAPPKRLRRRRRRHQGRYGTRLVHLH